MRTMPAILLALLLGGCPVIVVEPLRTLTPLPEVQTVSAEGDWVHGPTGTTWPRKLGDWYRMDIARYAEDDLDVSIGYNLGPMGVATFYLYPAWSRPGGLDDQIRELDDLVEADYGGVVRLGEEPVTVGGSEGRQATWHFDTETPVRTRMWSRAVLLIRGEWISS